MEQEGIHNFTLSSGRRTALLEQVNIDLWFGFARQYWNEIPLDVNNLLVLELWLMTETLNQCAFSQNETKQSSMKKGYFPVNLLKQFNCI